ncbi:preprotein translocase subunit SecE [Marinicauda salina]|uniref:Protein translocase subunit SecE n=2 Tax=Marinicauda salina TaxID=2135793 RepID=A0A2U2BRG6_9PROT|nr:preprotein translocase subunit SecE [Marinicauda salina]
MARQGKTRQPARTGASGKGGADAAPSAPARKKTTNPFKFLGEVRQEGRKVTWTSRRETIISTIMVVVMAAFAALFFFVADTAISFVINLLLGLGA